MEASEGVVRGNVNSLTKLISALEAAGIDFIAEGVPSAGGGRGVRLRHAALKAAPVDKRDRRGRAGRA